MPCVTASIKKPIHNVKEGANPPTPVETGFLVFISGVFLAALQRSIAGANLVEPIGIEPMTSSLQS